MRFAWLWVFFLVLQAALVRGDPTAEPTAVPTAAPTTPTAVPTAAPTLAPSAEPTPVSVFNRVSFVLTGLDFSQVDTTKFGYVKQAIADAFVLDVSAVSGLSITASSSVQQQRRLGRRLAANAVNVAATVVSVTAPSTFSATRFQTMFQLYSGMTTSVSSLTVADITPTASPVASPTSDNSFSLPIDLIIGLSVGGVAIFLVGCGVSLWFGREQKKYQEKDLDLSKRQHDHDDGISDSDSPRGEEGDPDACDIVLEMDVVHETKDGEHGEHRILHSAHERAERTPLSEEHDFSLVDCLVNPGVLLGFARPAEMPRRAIAYGEDDCSSSSSSSSSGVGGFDSDSDSNSDSDRVGEARRGSPGPSPRRGIDRRSSLYASPITPSSRPLPDAGGGNVDHDHDAHGPAEPKGNFGSSTPGMEGKPKKKNKRKSLRGEGKPDAATEKKKQDAFFKLLQRTLYRSLFVSKGVKRGKKGKKSMLEKMLFGK